MKSHEDKKTYFPGFDWLRGLLAAIVMLTHDRVIGWRSAGDLAVQVFFALSGWLIGGILVRMDRPGLPRFYFNRALRIWVPYYVALALLLMASVLRDPLNSKWWEFVAYKLTFVYNLFGPPQLRTFGSEMPLDGAGNHFWSVNAEEQFYLIVPIALVLARRSLGRSPWFWICSSVLAFVFGGAYSSIVLGVTAAVLQSKHGDIHLTPIARRTLLVLVISTAAAIAFGYSYRTVAPVFSVCVVLLLATPGAPSTIGTIVGGMSYPLYLNHWIGVIVGNAIFAPMGLRDSPARQLFAATLNIGFAVALYWFVDRRVLRARNSLYTVTRGHSIAATAYSMVAVGLTIGWLAGVSPAG